MADVHVAEAHISSPTSLPSIRQTLLGRVKSRSAVFHTLLEWVNHTIRYRTSPQWQMNGVRWNMPLVFEIINVPFCTLHYFWGDTTPFGGPKQGGIYKFAHTFVIWTRCRKKKRNLNIHRQLFLVLFFMKITPFKTRSNGTYENDTK